MADAKDFDIVDSLNTITIVKLRPITVTSGPNALMYDTDTMSIAKYCLCVSQNSLPNFVKYFLMFLGTIATVRSTTNN